nr:E3 ubiquitin-protein ligase Topors-like [Taeniopygia guttata]XP_041567010.1 E3 ubiquitin-protein ligase Topors-like [Taeniopygia guttata]XP_041567012.1 E3 ubiquitin-protein ligase Topors-like [Taeniopygia guttata]
MSRLPPAGPLETAAADGLCPICLGNLENATCVEVCRHYFCFICIWEWAKLTETCPLCKQPFKRLLRAGTADNNHEERVAGRLVCPPPKEGSQDPEQMPRAALQDAGVMTPSPPWEEEGLWGHTERREIHSCGALRCHFSAGCCRQHCS